MTIPGTRLASRDLDHDRAVVIQVIDDTFPIGRFDTSRDARRFAIDLSRVH